MIRANETEKLQLMFKLMDRVPDEGIAPMLADLEAHIYANGIADMVESADVITQDSEKYVEKLLALFRRFSQLVSDAFRYSILNTDFRLFSIFNKKFSQSRLYRPVFFVRFIDEKSGKMT